MVERPVDLSILTAFSPLDGLKAENLHALARKTQIRELDAGRVLFKEGDTDKAHLLSRRRHHRAARRRKASWARSVPAARKRARRSRRVCRANSPRVPLTDLSYIMIDSDLLDVL